MQIKYLHPCIYKLAKRVSKQENVSKIAEYRKKLLGDWELLKTKGCSDKEAARITEISRTTYYRRKKALETIGMKGLEKRSRRPKRFRKSKIPKQTRKLILLIRRGSPTYGKIKIAKILRRDHGIKLSESSVGRILHEYMEKGQISKYRASRKNRKKRKFKGHAKRWKGYGKSRSFGELVQVDHMRVLKNQREIKHFQAWDPKSKMIVTECYSTATSGNAERFLEKMMDEYPFEIKSIQVDGGSEFMSHFENKCENKKIELFVLPPKSPKLNGGVERGNRTFREDFYDQPLLANNISEFRILLCQATKKYNEFRPHQSLLGLTPFEYISTSLEENFLSHML